MLEDLIKEYQEKVIDLQNRRIKQWKYGAIYGKTHNRYKITAKKYDKIHTKQYNF